MTSPGGDRAPAAVLHPATYVNVAGGLLLGFGAVGVAHAAPRALTAIVIGAVLGMALDPVVNSVSERLGWTRHTSVTAVVAGTTAVVTAVVVLMAPRAVDQASGFTRDIPDTVRQFYDLPLIGSWLADHDAVGKVQQAIQQLPAQISDQRVSSLVAAMIGGALSAVLVLAVAIAVLLDGPRLVGTVRKRLPPHWLDRADEVSRIFYHATAQYFGGSLAVAALMGVVVLALCLVFGVPLAPVAALWAMITDLIPQIGGLLGGVLLGVLALSQGPLVFLLVVGIYVLYMNLENHVISPAVIGHAVDLTPPTTMIAVLLGGAVAGVPGALVATPLVGALKQLYLQLRYGEEPEQAPAPHPSRLRALLRRRSRAAG